ncbi:DUF2076 domain-containing protein [Rouxiella badensis]|jgi:hypothetical protein|uniref:ABC transporter substrate-binding protein n=1 Tax=Rouxiella badensis TaxID=1646377 RepID=A0A1X0WLA0_9GAMM|nr:DUF2076 domain-containing protein [Rouxiella badensis]MCC3717276.1 DUF2076 domain-containing protein [Rouxiella badensis]MCC3728372.1 DUF2076 domain-containing protein [Rouxiella badensis]MCC3732276.1 DUF2076 domain-containing protein [Rouxiella badensis]MCC3740116.1 DUF2076 domain-containing protein [Rouxiella badensis]MCC3745540.1 DUF2076 domain-containing protein [Rouxiella badensis]
MQSEEQRLIEGLFSRLQQAESNTAPRDAEAERLIQSYVSKQPSVPYYMAQAMIIQEAALKRLNAQVQDLQQQVAQLQNQLQTQAQNSKPQSTGFLAGLFGGGGQPQNQQSSGSGPIPGTQQNNGWGNNAAPAQPAYQQAPPTAAAAPIGSGFIGGALKTAAGVAGGVVLADMLTGMFHQSRPEEIVNVVENNQVTENFNPSTDPLLSGDNAWDNPVYNDNNNSNDNTYSGFLNDSDDSFFGGGNDDDDDDSFF